MAIVRFGDVVKRANTKEDKDNTELEFYVGGEHFESGEILVTKCGLIKGSTIGPMFYFGFKAGQVLIMSRNPHLKKAGMVKFDGICSEKTFVVESADQSVLLQEYLPFIVQSDNFWKFAEENKSGSVNYFVNWTTFARYEFELPSLDEQKKLAEVLWAAEEERQAIQKAIAEAIKLKEALYYPLFMQPGNCTLGDCVKKIVGGGTPSRANENNFQGDIPWATVKDIAENDKFKSNTMEYISQEAIDNSATNLIDANCLIIATRISLDRAFINTVPMTINQDLKALYAKDSVDIEYLYYWFKSKYKEILTFANGTTVLGIRLEHIKTLSVVLPDISVQRSIAQMFSKLDSEIANLQQLKFNLKDIQTNIMGGKPVVQRR